MASPDVEPYAADMVDLLMDLVRIENEENAVLCMKTIMDLERNQAKATAARVQPFLELIQEMFQTMDRSSGFRDTEEFLDRRLEDARTVGGAVGSSAQWIGFQANGLVNLLRSKGVRV